MRQLERRIEPAEVRDAWAEYLDEVDGLEPARYDEVECWAWARLLARLAAVRDREKVAA